MTIVIMDLDHSEDNINITKYFEESYNKDVSDIANNIESLFLKEGDSFDDFDKAKKKGVPSMTNTTTIFLSIESLAKCYLRLNVANFLVEQMKKSLYYTTSCATVEEIESLTSYESSQSKDIDDKSNAIVYETEEITNVDFIDEMLFYGKAWGLACTAINKYILHHDNKFILLIKNYLNKIYIKEEELVRSQEEIVALTSQNVAESTEDSMIQLENPQKVVGRGRPKAASHYNKNITNMTLQETSKKKHEQYTCRFCKESGHNIATCLNKS
ncbi:25025_t:CDS:2 [Cetraspora pellucida]|uniref:25025_t:CDS:1 n=1 Tax=Cetraspora pellucida TaxID=1433469 RepID=A0A9N9CS64_9GLOM|nr:25025_t:CDS:2 [Cetraspora pellucida]